MLKRHYYYLAPIALSVVYIVASLLAPLGPNRFNITPAKTHVIQLTILLPVVLIWAAAVYGAVKFYSYTQSIRRDKDGKALGKIAVGLILLVGAIMINGAVGVLRPWALKDGWLSAYTIFINYLSVALPLIAYAYMYSGSAKLRALTKKRTLSLSGTVIVSVFLILIAVLYAAVLLNYNYRSTTPDPNRYNSFYMSDPLILLTLALPYLIGWWLGIKAALNLNNYRTNVQGIIYKNALFRLVVGILVVIFFYIIVQMLVAFSTYIAEASLGSILLLVYILILMYAIGFLFIASGAKKLSAIEKVK
jgi:hypothetical protein